MAVDLHAHLAAVLEEADRLRLYLQSSYPKSSSGILIMPDVSDEGRRELLFGASRRARAALASDALDLTTAPHL